MDQIIQTIIIGLSNGLIFALVALGSATWVALLATGTAVVRRAAGERAIRSADAIAGVGLLGFGGALAYGAVHDR